MEERRKNGNMNQEDHDVLIRMDANVTNLIGLVEHHRKDFKSHMDNDAANFKSIGTEMQNIKDDIDRKHNFVMRIILPAGGAVSLGILLINWFHK